MQFGPSSHNPDPHRAPLDPHKPPAVNQSRTHSTLMRLPLEHALKVADEAAIDFALDRAWHEASWMTEQSCKIASMLYPTGSPEVVKHLLSLSNYQFLAGEFSKAEHTLRRITESLELPSIDPETRERSEVLIQYQMSLLLAKQRKKINYTELAHSADSDDLTPAGQITAWDALLKLSNIFRLNNLAVTVQTDGVKWAESQLRSTSTPAPIGGFSERTQHDILAFLRGCIREERDIPTRIKKSENLLKKLDSLPPTAQGAAKIAAGKITLILIQDCMLSREPVRAEKLAKQLVDSELAAATLDPWRLASSIQALADVIEHRYGMRPARERLRRIGSLPQVCSARPRIALIPKLVEAQLLLNREQAKQSMEVLTEAIRECSGSDFESRHGRFRLAKEIANIAKDSRDNELSSRFRELAFEYAKELYGENDTIAVFAWSSAVEDALESKELGTARLYLDLAPSCLLRADSPTLPAYPKMVLSRSKGVLALECNNPIDAVPFLEEAMRLCRKCTGLDSQETLKTLDMLIRGIEARLPLLRGQPAEAIHAEQNKLLDLYEEQMGLLESQPHPPEDKIIKSLRIQIALLDKLQTDGPRRGRLLGRLYFYDPHSTPPSSEHPRGTYEDENDEEAWDD